MAKSIVNEAPATIPTSNDLFDAACLKIGAAGAIIDVLAMLNVASSLDSLKTGSLTTCLLQADELLDEAKAIFSKAQAAQAKEVEHA